MITDYWMSPHAAVTKTDGSHEITAMEILLAELGVSVQHDEATEALMRRGWLRVVACRHSGNIFYERRVEPNEKQIARLKDLAIEHRCRLEHEGHTVYDPQGEAVPL